VTTVIVVGLILCALAGAPLFIVFGGVALALFHAEGIDISAVMIELYRMASAPTLIAIPLFTFAGYLLAETQCPQRMVKLYRSLFGWMPGGLAIVSLVACAFFTAFTGASGITIIALGGLLYPILIKERYGERFSLGLLTTSGSLGLLFPPSLPLILYAVVAKVNIDALFMAGIIPGILLVTILSFYSMREGVKSKVEREPVSIKNFLIALKEAAWIVPLPVIVVGGIYGGFFTASEAAAVTVVYVLFIELVIYRDLKSYLELWKIASDSMMLVGGILLILGCALGFTNYLIDKQVPMHLIEFIQQHVQSKWTFLILLNLTLLVVGCMMDVFSAIIVVVPLILPIAQKYGVHPVHLGIIFLTNLEIGYSTPPVGLNLFISSYRFKKPIATLARSAIPFLLLLLLALIIITYVPDLSLWLVRVFV
jgi:tripartite ATP-independent transporter DctM subunit